jgi:hypothetical protein
MAEGVAQLAKWLSSGELRSREQVIRGDVSDFPEILVALFRGKNTGKPVLALEAITNPRLYRGPPGIGPDRTSCVRRLSGRPRTASFRSWQRPRGRS